MSTNFLYSQAVTPGMVYSTHLARSAQSPPTSRKPSTVSSGGVAATEDPWRRQAELKDLSLDKKDNLRYIYRLMDTNGDKRVSPRELRAGLKEMGYDFFAHPVALDELVREIDEDLTGYISEGEFLNFFRREHSAILGKYENIPKSSLQSVMVFRYPSGRSDLFQGTKGVEVCLIPAASLASFLADAMKEKPRLQYNYWVEICGYDQQVFTATAEVFGFQHDDFSELLVFSQPNSKNVSGTIRAGRSYVFHEADLSRDPIPKRGVNIVGAIFCGGDHATPYYLSPEYLRGRRLDTSGKIHEIRVAQEQVGLFVPHERVLLSFVHPLEQLTADKRRKKLTSGFVSFSDYLAGAKVPKLKDIHDTRLLQARSVDVLFDRIRDRIDREFRHATRELSIARCTRMIVEKLVATNYSTRDKLRDWMELIDASVRGAMRTSVTGMHLEAMQDLLDGFDRNLKSLRSAVPENDEEYRDVIADVEKIRGSREHLAGKVGLLQDRLDKRKDENMNRTLYALTLVTTIAMPASILTGLFGMNFTDMSELDGENVGYQLFWILLLPTIFVITVVLIRLGVFHAVL